MSADNGIYITQWDEGYLVTHMQAVENIDYYEPGTEEWKYYQPRGKFYKTLDEAIKVAHQMEAKILADDCYGILEYGVNVIPGNRGTHPAPNETDEDLSG